MILSEAQKHHICELCRKHDPTVKNYADDFELQTSLAEYLEKISGEKANISNISHLCDECYTKINIPEEEEEEVR